MSTTGAMNQKKQRKLDNQLRKAARLWGIQTSYINAAGVLTRSSDQALQAILSALSHCENWDEAIHKKESERISQVIEPTTLSWQGEEASLLLTIPRSWLQAPTQLLISDEQFNFTPSQLSYRSISKDHVQCRFPIPGQRAVGYYDIQLLIKNKQYTSFLINAPTYVHSPYPKKSWGVFLPLYALRSNQDWGIGSLTELKNEYLKYKKYGAQWIGCLPLLALPPQSFSHSPSPYSPSSRLFWNEIFLDVEELAQKYAHSSVNEKIQNGSFQSQISQLRATEYVEYEKVYHLKKEILMHLSEKFFTQMHHHKPEYIQFIQQHPEMDAYAKFTSPHPHEQNYTRFVQFEMTQKVSSFKNLYMDYPVGVSPSGFDAHHFQSEFFNSVTMGAPPEALFAQGQLWGFSPLHPIESRKNGYTYLRKSLRHHFQFSRILRVDHVMALHRAYVVPHGMTGATDGAYIRYKPQELFALACTEAHLAQADLIGENLGTVPTAVNEILNKRKIKTMTVGQFEIHQKPFQLSAQIKANSLVCINTHDTATWAGFVSGEDLSLVEKLNILSPELAQKYKSDRLQQLKSWGDHPLLEMIKTLGQSLAHYFLLNPEDLWGEHRMQNLPGTSTEFPNWKRKFIANYHLENSSEALRILNLLYETRS